MRALVTGGTGFLGRHVVRALRRAGHQVDVLGRSGPLHADLTAGPPALPASGFDVVYHVAGRAHMRPRTDEDARAFFAVNAEGTANLLKSVERQRVLPEAVVLVSTVAVYGRTAGEGLDESTRREARDPYGLSKRQAEDIVRVWGGNRGVRIGIVRLPLVAGRGAPGNLNAMLRAMRGGRYLGIGGGEARRSVVRAVDVAEVLPAVAARGGVYHLTDGVHPSFREIERALASALRRPAPPRLPTALGRLGAAAGDRLLGLTGVEPPLTSEVFSKMTSTLTFDDRGARQTLGWAPRPVLEHVDEWLEVPGRREWAAAW